MYHVYKDGADVAASESIRSKIYLFYLFMISLKNNR